MIKRVFYLVLLALLASFSYAQQTEKPVEFSFASLGYEDFVADSSGCQKYNFRIEKPNKEEYVVFSLKADFLPVADNHAEITVKLNNKILGNYTPSNFISGWKRILLEKRILDEENEIEICVNPKANTLKIKIYNESKVGKYLMPDIKISQYVAKDKIQVGEEFEVLVKVDNYGSREANVKIIFSPQDPEEVFPFIRILKGDLEKELLLDKCKKYDDEKCIEPATIIEKYVLRAKKNTTLSLQPSILKYTNIFGEEITMKTERTYLEIKKNIEDLNIEIFAEDNVAKANEPKEIYFKIKNGSKYSIYDIKIKPEIKNNTKNSIIRFLDNAEIKAIEEIRPDEVIEIKAIFLAKEEGTYVLSCSLIGEEKKCNNFEILVEKSFEKILVVVSIVSLLIGLLIIIYIYMISDKKGKKKEEEKKKVGKFAFKSPLKS
ncbi:MAG: hypothetical protein N3D73_02365 [Candidatus Diapherotrites archaeon]|nr:hypothetical protein [Candidatus Diapherotrites archaeon]